MVMFGMSVLVVLVVPISYVVCVSVFKQLKLSLVRFYLAKCIDKVSTARFVSQTGVFYSIVMFFGAVFICPAAVDKIITIICLARGFSVIVTLQLMLYCFLFVVGMYVPFVILFSFVIVTDKEIIIRGGGTFFRVVKIPHSEVVGNLVEMKGGYFLGTSLKGYGISRMKNSSALRKEIDAIVEKNKSISAGR